MSSALKNQWWSTSDGSTFLPTATSSSSVAASSPSANPSAIPTTSRPSVTTTSSGHTSTSPIPPSSASSGPVFLSSSLTTFTTSVPIAVSDPSTTFTSFSLSTVTSSRVFTAFPDSETVQAAALVEPVCIGDGVDASSLGLLATLVIPSVIGLLIWLLFAILRPRYRQVYGLREWFVQQSFRPKPLGRSFWAFLFPHVPLVPSLPSDVSDAGRSPAKDAALFPSDEQLSQRVLWICTVIAAGWTILALVGFLPLYMVSTPCLADSIPRARYTGAYSVLQDLSLLRLLHLLDAGQVTTADIGTLASREIVNGRDAAPNARIRIIIATVLAIVLGLLPVLWKILKEFNRMVAYRERWVEVRCQGLEMGWLSARRAPGFVGWGEKRLKDYLVKIGLSSCLDANDRNARSRRRRRAQELNNEERGDFEIDIQSLFSIGDTAHLALLIDERDEVLENLEVAETKYINSFRLTTPEPSMADWEPPVPPPKVEPEGPPRPPISRPLPLSSAVSHRRRRRGRNPAYASSSLPPTSYVMPYQFYKITDLGGISGGHFTDPERDLPSSASRRSRQTSFTDSVSRRIVGSRFQEVNRNSMAYGRLPIGSQLKVDNSGELSPVTASDSPVPDTGLYEQDRHASWDTTGFSEAVPPQPWYQNQQQHPEAIPEDEEPEEDWHDVAQEDPEAFQHAEEYPAEARRRPRPPRTRTGAGTPIEEHRETFPMRNRSGPTAPEEVPPPHLRLQPRQPFVRPLSGLNHDQLGQIYADINHWRWKLKVINTEIAEVQRECYNDIADGARIKGWLMIGRGLRHLPGIQLIEGRAKEDIRWDELQNEGDWTSDFMWWLAVIMIGILLGIGLTAVSGLAVATAPDFAHYFPFFMPLNTGNQLGAGVASTLGAAVAATLFTAIAFMVLHQLTPMTRTVSVSGSQFLMFRTMFYTLLVVGGAWMFTTGAILFSMRALSTSLDEAPSVANGAIYMSAFALVVVLNVAIIFPGLLLLQPIRLWKVARAEKAAVTPRQRFRAVYPRTYDPSYATSCSVLAIIFASAFALIFPLLAPAVLLLLFLTLIAHRYLVGYVYGRTLSQTGGLLYIWLLRRLGTVLAFQPLLLGLIFLSRRLWVEGGILCGAALFVVLVVESFCSWRTSRPGLASLSPITVDSLATFQQTAMPGKRRDVDEESTSLVSSARNTRARGSFASVLEMMSVTLAVSPSASETRGPVPLETENLDDLTATERAARTNPDAPPHLPPLPFADHAEEMAGVLYAPELLAPPPMIWLPNDVGGIGRSEAYDLQRYHNLPVTLDVRAKEDIHPRRSVSSAQSPHAL